MKKLKPTGLRQHYLQHRYDDVVFNESLHKSIPNITVNAYLESCGLKNSNREERYYNGNDDRGDDYYYYRNEEENYQGYLRGIEWRNTIENKGVSSCMTVINSKNDQVDIEQRLFDFMDNVFDWGWENTSDLLNFYDYNQAGVPNYAVIKQYLACPQSINIIEKTYSDSDCILFFSPFWIRSPLTWDKEGKENLLQHLFVLYEVPMVLAKAWSQDKTTFILWFLLYAQGGSLKKASKIFGWNIASHKLWSELYEVPAKLSLLNTEIYTEITRLGGSDKIYTSIINNPSFAIDNANKLSLEFWYSTVRWLICNCDNATTKRTIARILTWARHKYTESGEDNQRFSLKKKSFDRVLVRTNIYHQQVDRYGKNWFRSLNGSSWNSHNWDWVLKTSDEELWEITELASSHALYVEGYKMRHCISSYARNCLSGYSAIFSLKCNGARKATIEISPLSKVLKQSKGFANQEPTSEQQLLIYRWLNEVVKNN